MSTTTDAPAQRANPSSRSKSRTTGKPAVTWPLYPPTPEEADPATFDWIEYLQQFPAAALERGAGRRNLTRYNPLLFALIYFRHHLTSDATGGQITFSDFHLDSCRIALDWARPVTKPKQYRHAVVAPRETGKALAEDTPVLTHNRGWVRHGDLVAGDQVYDENGKPCNVTGVQAWGERPAYEIEFSDGSRITADENHEWLVNDRYAEGGRASIRETKWMADRYLAGARGDRRFSVPKQAVVKGKEQDLPIDPYLLGAWLGDGTSDAGSLTVGAQDLDEMLGFLRNLGENPVVSQTGTGYRIQLSKPRPDLCPREHPLTERRDRPGNSYAPCKVCVADHQKMKAAKRAGQSMAEPTNRPLIARLRDLGVLGNKHIPDVYMNASVEQRMALLQGLMDTDGYVGTDGGGEFVQGQKRGHLARQVLMLLRSLGITATLKVGLATIDGRDCGEKYRVVFRPTSDTFRLQRKRDRVKKWAHERTRTVVNMTPVRARTHCISVDSPSHLYLAGESLVATHNSTWHFLILPMWAAAHGHVKFLAAYSDTATQAQRHLETFKRELETNALLNRDFKELAEPSRKKATGRPIADNMFMLQTANGFTFSANGIESGTLGLKVGQLRPDLLVLDDIEPGESTYSLSQVGKRLSTVQDVIFPLNLHARVVIAGTVTMPGSIIHQMVQSVSGGTEKPSAWIAEENIKVHHYKPIIDLPGGEQRSLWPAKWSIEFLRSIQHTRSYSKNFANEPIGQDGTYWDESSFRFTDNHDGIVATYLSIDPSVTDRKTSDYTGLAVVSYRPAPPNTPVPIDGGLQGTAIVRHASHIRVSPGPDLRRNVLNLLREYTDIRTILIETNQGGDTWNAILHDMPVPIQTVHQSVKKEVRAARLLTEYETGHVLHEGHHTDAENEMMQFPNGSNDDMVDAVGTAVARLREQEARRRTQGKGPRARSGSYA